MSGESSVRELRATGLQGVSLGETEIALVDGENGRLIYRGHDAERLAHESTFEATAFLLWNGRLPDDARALRAARSVRSRPWSCRPRCTTRSARSARARCRWTSCATGLSVWGAMRGRAEGGDSEDALWALAATPAIVADYRAPALGRRAARARSRSRDRRELPVQAQRQAARPGAGARARRVLHPRRRARHERLDVHRTRDRLDALRPRLGPRRRGRARSRARSTAARRATSRT